MIRDMMRSQQERVQNERSRRSSIAHLLHDRAQGEDAQTFTPAYDEEDPYAVDPTNLASALGDEDLQLYYQLVETTQAEPFEQAPLGGMNAPQPAMATGGNATEQHLAAL